MRWLVLFTLGPVFAQNPGVIEGLVVDPTGGQIPGVTAELAPTETGPSLADLRTDDHGRFRFLTVQPGSYYVRFRMAGFFTLRRGPLSVTNGDRLNTGTVQLSVSPPGGSVCCACEGAAPRFLIDLGQNASFGGRVNAPRMDLNGEATLTASSGGPIRIRIEDDGVFTFKALPPGRYALRITVPGYAPFEVPEIEITARLSLRIDGWISLSDCPASTACKPTRTILRERKSSTPRFASNETSSPSRTSI